MPAAREPVTSKLDERIETLQKRLKQLKARQARIEARKRALATRRARQDDTRRKILAGAVLLAKVESGDFDSRTFRRWMDKALTRREDRELFGLADPAAK
jgi:multidrug efflux pump subunit AcrA (membrane-fusion protein)